MFTWLKNLNEWRKTLLYIVKNYNQLVIRMDELTSSHIRVVNNVNEAVDVIRERTGWHADVKVYQRDSPNQIIVIGNYRGRDYIEIFNVPADDFPGVVAHCKDVSRFAHRGTIDAIPEMKMILEKETKWWWDK